MSHPSGRRDAVLSCARKLTVDCSAACERLVRGGVVHEFVESKQKEQFLMWRVCNPLAVIDYELEDAGEEAEDVCMVED